MNTNKLLIALVIVLIGIIATLYPPTQVASESTIEEDISSPITVELLEVEDPGEIKPYDNLVRLYSKKYEVSYSLMDAILDCENTERDTSLQSFIKYTQAKVDRNPRWNVVAGERERSFGLAQIHLPDHSYVSEAEAKDPDFSIEFMARNISDGRASMWSCYHKVI